VNRALSKLGILSRSEATLAIRAGRVRVNGRVVADPAVQIVPERARISIDGVDASRTRWRTILFHKPRGTVTTRRDPEGRRTVYDVIGEAAAGLIPVGRLDYATTGLLLLTTDTQLANRITDPLNAVPRLYVVTARGRITEGDVARLDAVVTIRKSSARETHLVVELRRGRNREARRLFESIGHEVTRLKRIRFGSLELGVLQPGEWRDVSQEEIDQAFPKK
jgi:pseudouridine synthase